MSRVKKKNKFNVIVILLALSFIITTLGHEAGVINVDINKLADVFKKDDYASEYIVLMDREDKKIKHKKNHESKAYPASLIKIMTTIVALENLQDLSQVAPVDIDTYRKMVSENASMAGFHGKEAVTYRDLLYGTILSSGGEAANSLAVNISGNAENFVKLMNEKAAELKLDNTNFTNPEGLDDDYQYTTAHDMAKLLDYALNNSDFKEIFTEESYRTTQTLDHPEGVLLKSTVFASLEGRRQDGFSIAGGKSGTTSKAGQCWATLAIKEGREYLCIVMGAPLGEISNPEMAHVEDSLRLYEEL